MKQPVKKTEKLAKKVKHIKHAVRVGSVLWNYIIPWTLVVFAAASYAILGVKIPEKKVRKKYKETWI